MYNMFPYNEVRPGQKEFMEDVAEAIEDASNLIAHAPTGVGKTAAVLTPALKYSLENGKTVLFLTNRHSQHLMAIETLKEISDKKRFRGADLIGKKHMCAYAGLSEMPHSDFSTYCSHLRKNDECDYYNKTRENDGKLKKVPSMKVKEVDAPLSTQEVKKKFDSFCPYEMTIELIKMGNALVCDYFHLFTSEDTRIINKTDISLEDCIVIVDEAHNLPERLKSLLSFKLSTYVLENAIEEANEFEFAELEENLEALYDGLRDIGSNVSDECFFPRMGLIRKVNRIRDYDEFVKDLDEASDDVLDEKKRSFLSSVSTFLESWKGENEGYARILRNKDKGEYISLTYSCLDPSIVSSSVIEGAHSTVLMSGTMKPMDMYSDLLGIPDSNTRKVEYESDFPENNRLVLTCPEVTSKYSERGPEMYGKISKKIKDCTDKVAGNTIVFFPSYYMMNKVHFNFSAEVHKEKREWGKSDREEIIDKFRTSSDNILFAVMGGSFYEGVDFPGEALKCVMVVGVPMAKPDLLMKSTINYYDDKFSDGWDYAYLYPALMKVVQAIGRLIRSKNDEGVAVLLDDRYLKPKYREFFSEFNLKNTRNPEDEISNFFGSAKKKNLDQF